MPTIETTQTTPRLRTSFTKIQLPQRITSVDKIFFLQHLEVLIRTGFSLAEALGTVSESIEKPRFKEIISQIKISVEKGQTLSDSMQPYQKIFPDLLRSMIHAGEVSGNLDVALKQLLLQQRKRYELISQIKGALSYPAVIVFAMIVIGTGVVLFIFPKITLVFEEAEFDLPLITRIMIGATTFTSQNIIFILLGLIAIIAGAIAGGRTDSGRRFLHHALLRIPVLAPVLQKINLASFTRNLSALLRTDIPINESFNIVASTVSLVPYREALSRVGGELEKGSSIHATLEKEPKLFPPLVTKLVATGEKSGTLDRLLEEIAVFYENEVSHTLKNLSSIIEPVLMLVIGVLVGAFAISILLPFYTLVQKI